MFSEGWHRPSTTVTAKRLEHMRTIMGAGRNFPSRAAAARAHLNQHVVRIVRSKGEDESPVDSDQRAGQGPKEESLSALELVFSHSLDIRQGNASRRRSSSREGREAKNERGSLPESFVGIEQVVKDRPVLINIASKIVRSRAQAEDVVQDTVIAVWQRPEHDWPVPRGLLLRILLSRAIDSYRHHSRQTKMIDKYFRSLE